MRKFIQVIRLISSQGKEVHDNRLVLFETNEVLNKKIINRLLRENPNPTMVVLENSAKLGLNYPIKATPDYFNPRELIDERNEILNSVLKSLLEDPTLKPAFTIDGVFYLKLVREDIGYLLLDVIEKILVVERIISKEKPSKINVFESHDLLTATLPIPLGKIVIPIANKRFIHVSVRSPRLSQWVLKVKSFLTPLVFLKMSFKRYALVRIKSFLLSDLKTKSQNFSDAKRKTVLFIPYSHAERTAMEPILERLSSFKEIRFLAIAYPNTDENAKLFENQWKKRKGKVPVYSFGEYSNSKNMNQATSKYREIMNLWRKNKHLFYTSEGLKLNGISLGEIIREKFETLFKCWIKDCVQYFFVTKEMIRREKVDAIFTAKELGMFIRSIIEAASQHGIPSIYIQHGIDCDNWFWGPLDFTKLCVDETLKDILIKRGEDPGKIIVTGAPRYDLLFKKIREEDEDNIKRRLGLNQDKRYLCFLTSSLPEWSTAEKREELLTTIIKSAREIDHNLIIKLHPREKKKEVQVLVNKVAKTKEIENRIRIFEFEEKDLFDVVLASDIVVSVRTSALITALLANKPAILINFDPSIANPFPGIEGKIFGLATSHTELFEMIKDVVRKPRKAKNTLKSAEKYARKYAPYRNATDRVINCLLELID